MVIWVSVVIWVRVVIWISAVIWVSVVIWVSAVIWVNVLCVVVIFCVLHLCTSVKGVLVKYSRFSILYFNAFFPSWCMCCSLHFRICLACVPALVILDYELKTLPEHPRLSSEVYSAISVEWSLVCRVACNCGPLFYFLLAIVLSFLRFTTFDNPLFFQTFLISDTWQRKWNKRVTNSSRSVYA